MNEWLMNCWLNHCLNELLCEWINEWINQIHPSILHFSHPSIHPVIHSFIHSFIHPSINDIFIQWLGSHQIWWPNNHKRKLCYNFRASFSTCPIPFRELYDKVKWKWLGYNLPVIVSIRLHLSSVQNVPDTTDTLSCCQKTLTDVLTLLYLLTFAMLSLSPFLAMPSLSQAFRQSQS